MQELKIRLLDEIQQDIPFVRKPFDVISERLGISLGKTVELLKDLKEKGIIRQIAPIYDTKSLGYISSLVAFKIEDDYLQEAVKILNAHPGISHNYLREDEFNVWFTIALPPDSRLGLDNTIDILKEKTKATKYVVLNTKRVFKISARFVEDGLRRESINKPKIFFGTLSEIDKLIVKYTQYDLPIVENPFDELAYKIDIDVETLLKILENYRNSGIIRRFSGLLNHKKAGYMANGMSVWEISDEKVEAYGVLMSSFKAVTHCYERTTNEDWPYNLFCMIHGKTKEEVYTILGQIKDSMEINIPHKVLFSSKEFKKVRLRYFEEDYYIWEENNHLV
ncbi:MAG: Lrp/AsnC family transcriptional regulator [Candidatus Methanomethylicia archaeon]